MKVTLWLFWLLIRNRVVGNVSSAGYSHRDEQYALADKIVREVLRDLDEEFVK